MKKIILLMISIFFINVNNVYAKDIVKYSACVDGDTIKVILNNEKVVVRLLAVDTPESVKEENIVEYYGKESSEFTCNEIKKAKKIELEYDPKSDKYDKYDRLLAWVFVDNKLLQEKLVKGGYAKVAYLYDDYKYKDLLLEVQTNASNEKKGIWDEEAKNKYENNETITDEDNPYANIEVIIITIFFLLLVFISKLRIKK